jgi:hypothetical protein
MARPIHLSVSGSPLCRTLSTNVTEQIFNTTCERCLRSIVKRVPEAQAQIDWLRSQRQED